jgi:hypothetical protein
MHIKIDYCYLYYHYLLIAMATIRKLTSDLEKIVLCDDVEKYVKYMVKMKSKHKTFTQVYVTGFIQACKHVKLNIAKYIYDEDLKKTVQLITQDIIFDELKYALINKNESIYTWVKIIWPRNNIKKVRSIFIKLCEMNYITEIKWLKQHYALDVHANDDSMLQYCFKYGYIDLGKWIRVQPTYISEKMIDECCKYGHLEMLKAFDGRNAAMSFRIIENCCSNGQYKIFTYLCESYNVESLYLLFSIAIEHNRRQICEYLIGKSDKKSNLIKTHSKIKISKQILDWLVAEHLDIFEDSYNDIFVNHVNILAYSEPFLNKYDIVLNDTYNLYQDFNTFDDYSDDTLMYLIDNKIEMFKNVYKHAFIRCCKLKLDKQITNIANKYTIDNEMVDEWFFYACSYGHLLSAKAIYAINPNIDIRRNDDVVFNRACFKERKEVCDWLCTLNNIWSYVDNGANYGYDIIYKMPVLPCAEFIDDLCCVCMDKTNTKTNCGHIICLDCVNKVNHHTCPMCRGKIEHCYKGDGEVTVIEVD